MSYTPTHYRETRRDLALDAIRSFSFATLITAATDAPCISHLPLLLSDDGLSLTGHCARANPQWRHLKDRRVANCVFHGPHSYISPAWYAPKPDNVPTWNYVAIHVRGRALVMEDPLDIRATLEHLVTHFERLHGTAR